MVSIASYVAAGPDTDAAISALDRRIAAEARTARFAYAFFGCGHDGHAIHAYLQRRFPETAILGGTSCSGVMNQEKLWSADSIGLLLIDDPGGEYGVAGTHIGDDAAGAAEQALRAAMQNAECPGELPELIWVFQAPGREEEVVEGLRRVVGDRCPIIGGSSADDTVEGNWCQLGPDGVMTDGLVVGVLFPSGGVGYSFQSGYEPAGPSGIVTRIGGSARRGCVTKARGRHILEIDGMPAAQIYNGWIGHLLDTKAETGGSILADTTMCPLAIDAGQIEGITQYILVHPESITRDGALTTFASIEEGTRVHSMRGDRRQLIDRAGRVTTKAAQMLPGGAANIAGGLVVYCAGCKMAVEEQMPAVVDAVRSSFDGKPFLGCFTFGEQGCVVDRNVHGNLMISAVVFGR
jgi:hypothetical protein